MQTEIIPARPDVDERRVAELIWTVNVPLMSYLFHDEETWARLLATDWRHVNGLVCHAKAHLAVDDGKVVGVLVCHDPLTLDENFEQSMQRWAETEPPDLVSHLETAFLMMDRLCPHPRPNEYFVLDIAVSPSQRNKGLGRRLMTAAIDQAKALGKSAICLDVIANNPAVGFYKALGMQIEAEIRLPYLDENYGLGMHYHMVLQL
jgi:ribosomal protein S18 acetylase RimI-like enzyme